MTLQVVGGRTAVRKDAPSGKAGGTRGVWGRRLRATNKTNRHALRACPQGKTLQRSHGILLGAVKLFVPLNHYKARLIAQLLASEEVENFMVPNLGLQYREKA
jgi:hypothetical protein